MRGNAMEKLIGKGRAAVDMVVDPGSFREDMVGDLTITDKEFGPGAVIGTAMLSGETCTVISHRCDEEKPQILRCVRRYHRP